MAVPSPGPPIPASASLSINSNNASLRRSGRYGLCFQRAGHSCMAVPEEVLGRPGSAGGSREGAAHQPYFREEEGGAVLSGPAKARRASSSPGAKPFSSIPPSREGTGCWGGHRGSRPAARAGAARTRGRAGRAACYSTLIIRVLPSVLGLTLARSRNSATPSSCDRRSSEYTTGSTADWSAITSKP
jgi:hypothetical protein